MAEVLGIVAGAAQLLDLSTRIVLASSGLYTKLKNVPGEIETLKYNTELLINLLEQIKRDFEGPVSLQSSSLHIIHDATSIFHEATKELEVLAQLLEGISANASSSARRAWSAVLGVKKQADIADKCRRIEYLKSSLQLWYQHQSINRSRVLEEKLSQLTSSLLLTQSDVRQLTEQSTTIINSNQAIALQLRSQNDAGISSREASQYHLAAGNGSCTCRPHTRSSHVTIWKFQLFFSRHISHAPSCRCKIDSHTWSWGLRALNPRMQAVLGLKLDSKALSTTWGLSFHNLIDPFRSPTFLAIEEARCALRSVRDLKQGPLYREWNSGSIPVNQDSSSGISVYVPRKSSQHASEIAALRLVYKNLRRNLLEAFDSGVASPTDQTPAGDTILHKFVEFSMECIGYHDSLHDLLNLIVGDLVGSVTQTNYYTTHGSLSPLCVVFDKLRDSSFRYFHHIESPLRLDTILISHGFDASDLLQEIAMQIAFAGIFNKFPHLLEDYGQRPDHMAVIARSETQLCGLLRLNKVNFQTKTPTILSLAVGWPAGLRILLDAGGDPLDALHHAMVREELLSVEILLDEGIPMFFTDEAAEDLLRYAETSVCSSAMTCLIIQKLTQRRQALFQLAIENLPRFKMIEYGYGHQTHSVVDYNAIKIFEQLEAHIEVPRALWPGHWASIYHHFTVIRNVTLARKFYEAGFLEIDKPDENGDTPLVIILTDTVPVHHEQMKMIQWLLDTGATLPPNLEPTHIVKKSTGLTAFSSADIWITQNQELFGRLDVFRQLFPGDIQFRDNCTCWCSTGGCTPTGVVLRRKASKHGTDKIAEHWRLVRRRRWLFILPRYSCLGLSLDLQCFTDLCRLEIFDRLGMAHTCCDRSDHGLPHYRVFKQESNRSTTQWPIHPDERIELQEEDRLLKQTLESYLELYLGLLERHQGDFERFWISWWFILDYWLPFEWPGKSSNHPESSQSECSHSPQVLKTDSQRLQPPGSFHFKWHHKARHADGYNPNAMAITHAVEECAEFLDEEAKRTFLDQLLPDPAEWRYNWDKLRFYEGAYRDSIGWTQGIE